MSSFGHKVQNLLHELSQVMLGREFEGSSQI